MTDPYLSESLNNLFILKENLKLKAKAEKKSRIEAYKMENNLIAQGFIGKEHLRNER